MLSPANAGLDKALMPESTDGSSGMTDEMAQRMLAASLLEQIQRESKQLIEQMELLRQSMATGSTVEAAANQDVTAADAAATHPQPTPPCVDAG